jgi:hypothetical protein
MVRPLRSNPFARCQLTNASTGDGPRVSRTQRSQDASNEALSLAPKPAKGVDARSLAAKPPPSFTIRRVDEGPTYRGRGGGGNFVPRTGGNPKSRGSGGMKSRGRGGANRGRGSRGRGRGAKKERAPRKKEEEEVEEPYTEEELKSIEGVEQGWFKPYEPETSLESLRPWAPPVAASHMGLQNSVHYKMSVATWGRPTPYFQPGIRHLENIDKGIGTMFNDTQERNMVEAFRKQKGDCPINVPTDKLIADVLSGDWSPPEEPENPEINAPPRGLQSLHPKTRNEVMRQWIAGHYSGTTPAERGDILAQVALSARRNETYLPADAQKLGQKLSSLLPGQTGQSAPGNIKSPL